MNAPFLFFSSRTRFDRVSYVFCTEVYVTPPSNQVFSVPIDPKEKKGLKTLSSFPSSLLCLEKGIHEKFMAHSRPRPPSPPPCLSLLGTTSLQFHTKKGKRQFSSLQVSTRLWAGAGGVWIPIRFFPGSCRPLFPLISIPPLPQIPLLFHTLLRALQPSPKKKKESSGGKLVQYTGTNNGASFRSKDPVCNSRKKNTIFLLNPFRTSKFVLHTASLPDQPTLLGYFLQLSQFRKRSVRLGCST